MPTTSETSKLRYKTDLSDAEWAIIRPLIPPEKPGGRHRSVDMREVLNAIFYLNKTGCSWEMLPKDFPPYSTVYYYHRRWQRRGVWLEINRTLRELLRQDVGKNALPTAAAIDSQSVKTTEKKGRSMAMMAARRSKDVNDFSSSIASDWC